MAVTRLRPRSKLEMLLYERHMSVHDLADQTGLSYGTTYTAIKRGIASAQTRTLISRALGLPVDQIFLTPRR